MATTSDISRGLIIKLDGSLYTVVEFGENKTARAAAKVWAKLKGVDNNRTIEKTWNSVVIIFIRYGLKERLTSFYIRMIPATISWIMKLLSRLLCRRNDRCSAVFKEGQEVWYFDQYRNRTTA